MGRGRQTKSHVQTRQQPTMQCMALTNVVLMGYVTVVFELLVISMPTISWMRSTVRMLHVTPKAQVMALVTHARTVAPCWSMTALWLGTMRRNSLQSSSISEPLLFHLASDAWHVVNL